MTIGPRLRPLSLALLCLAGLAHAQGLRHDPFARPPPAARAPTESERRPETRPELRAIMAAGPDSLVNIDGTLLRRGEEYMGYRLLEVHDETAVFVFNKQRVSLSMPGFAALPPAPANRNDRSPPPGGDQPGTPEIK